MGITKTIDTRGAPCACCHGAVFDAFERFRPGDALCIVADHDPTPLWYQFELRWTGRYRWTWCEAGTGGRWQVRVERRTFDGQPTPRFDTLPRNPGCPRSRRKARWAQPVA